MIIVIMKICVLNSSYDASTSVFSELDPYSDPASYYTGTVHTFHNAYIGKTTAREQIKELVKEGFDVFVNLCDGAADEDRAGQEVVELLEFYGQAYTGADPQFYEPSREKQKMVARECGVMVPRSAFIYKKSDTVGSVMGLRYPLIVKHHNGYSSIGMTKRSRCETIDEVVVEVGKMIDSFGGALVEEFIEGREFTALVGENCDDAFEPIECVFGGGETFKHFDLKWKDYGAILWVVGTDVALNDAIKEVAKKMFVGLGGVGYGRIDVRVGVNGVVYYLEMNPNCGIFYPKTCEGSADYILLNSKMGHEGFLEHIIKCAVVRQGLKKFG